MSYLGHDNTDRPHGGIGLEVPAPARRRGSCRGVHRTGRTRRTDRCPRRTDPTTTVAPPDRNSLKDARPRRTALPLPASTTSASRGGVIGLDQERGAPPRPAGTRLHWSWLPIPQGIRPARTRAASARTHARASPCLPTHHPQPRTITTSRSGVNHRGRSNAFRTDSQG
jgi:hypothetical protein